MKKLGYVPQAVGVFCGGGYAIVMPRCGLRSLYISVGNLSGCSVRQILESLSRIQFDSVYVSNSIQLGYVYCDHGPVCMLGKAMFWQALVENMI